MSDAPNSDQQSAPNPTPHLSDERLASTRPQADARVNLRKQLLSARRALQSGQVQECSSTICDTLLALIKTPANVGGYLALGNEIRIDTLLMEIRQQSCKTYVPIIQHDHKMIFALMDDETTLIQNSFGILEPDLTTAVIIPANALDVVLVPLVGFDQQCQRMGMGGGYYDRAFATNREIPDNPEKPLLIGVAYDMQQTMSVMPDWWDVPLDIIVTETQILRRTDIKA